MSVTIKSVKDTGRTFVHNDKTYLVHEYELSDGVKGQANHMKSMPFKNGDSIEYEVKRENEKYGKTLSIKKPNSYTGGGNKSKYNSVGAAVGAALNNAVSMFIHDKITKEKIPAVADWLVSEAKKLETKHGE